MSSNQQELTDLEQRGERMLEELEGWLGSGMGDDIPREIATTRARLKAEYLDSYPAVQRQLTLCGRAALLVFFAGAVDRAEVERELLEPLQAASAEDIGDPGRLLRRALPGLAVKQLKSWQDVEDEYVAGHLLLFVDGVSGGLAFDIKKIPVRSLSAPTDEQSVRGPQVAFIEDLKSNLGLLRDRVRTPRLKVWHEAVGTDTKTQVAIAHIAGRAKPDLVMQAQHVIGSAQPRDLQILSSITGLLEQRPYSLFPQVRMTTRVDEAAQAVLAGRLLVMMHGDPTAALYPATLGDFYRTMQDYMMTFWEASYVRILRTLATLVALYLPAFYVVATDTSPDLIPTRLAIVIAGSREGVPFTPLLEVVIMMVFIELLREAALRMPKQMSSTLGTVGAIVLGTALVKAGLISDLMIVVATVTALAMFTAPTFEITSVWRIMAWPMAVAASLWGFLGIVAVSFVLVASLASLEVAGEPYLAPLVPGAPSDMRDAILRLPMRSLGPLHPGQRGGSLLTALGVGRRQRAGLR